MKRLSAQPEPAPGLGSGRYREIAVLSVFRRLSNCERAATRLEYTLIAALIALLAYQAGLQFEIAGSPLI